MAENSYQNEITFFAETNFRGQRKRFGIKAEDRRKHVYIIGKTGMGKTTLLYNMTIQDIMAGRGVAVVDPHGEYAESMLEFVPKERINDVVYLNPADTDYPVAFNIMENVRPDQRFFVSQGLIAVFKKIWDPELWSARMEYLLANALLALLEIPGTTLLSINRMFGEKEYRKRVVARLTDPIIKSFWENEFAKYPEQYMREAVAAIQNKAGQFASNPLVRNVIGQAVSSFDIRRIMDEQKILIVNLSKGKIGEENSSLLGAMVVTKLYLTAMGRVDTPERERKDFYLYVDEFQNFATESFASILSEARKYRLNLTIAHQYVTQMDEKVQDAVMGNVGTMVVFRVGAPDAELFEKEFMPEFTGQDLVNLGFKNIYVKLMIDGITSRPFSAETLPPFPPPAESHRDAIIRASRERYGTPRSVVEENIRRFSESAFPQGETGGGAETPLASQKPERKMYEAQCAVDGRKIMIPFQPDGVRPVYCEEHMDMIKFRSKGAAPAAPVEPAPRPALDSPQARPGRQPPARPISLHNLRPTFSRPANRPAQPESPDKERHLAELRKALEESRRPEKPATPEPSTEQPSVETGRAGILRPGETIKLE